MKKFKITASYVTYVYAEVEANTRDEAFEMALDMDGGDFSVERDTGMGDWHIDDVVELEPSVFEDNPLDKFPTIWSKA